jgi:hypothetical protein
MRLCYSGWVVDVAPDDDTGISWLYLDDNDREWLTECSNDALTEYAGGDAGWACDADGCWEDGSGYQWDSIAIDYRCEAEWLGDACSESSNQL